MNSRARRFAVVLAGALLGGGFFFWIAGVRVLTPTETAWAMQLDWEWHFLGWHFFRHEPWHLPPGQMDGYLEPMGTAIGFTDSIPIAALAFKPFAALLPPAFQYLGLWMLLCFTLQGAFGVLLMRLWTSSVAVQLLGAACFVLPPTLLSRVGHPALCAHWLLLWAIWLYLRPSARVPWLQVTALGLVAGLIHPYLAVMMLGLVTAFAVRLALTRRVAGLATIVLAVGGVVTGWWLSGLFTVSGAENLAASGLTQFSMNLLGPITPSGWSGLMPELPVAKEGQLWEGFQYLGLGLIVLLLSAAAVRGLRSRAVPRGVVLWPLCGVAVVFAVYALSPEVTLGTQVIAQFDGPLLDRLAVFRATGRFFWPTLYVLLAAALAVICTRLPRPWPAVLLGVVVVLQMVDVHPGHLSRYRVSRDPAFHAWRPVLASPAWDQLLPHYAHVVIFPPTYCAGTAVDFASIAYLAGRHGLTLNSGLVARIDNLQRLRSCRDLLETLRRGEVDDSRIYLGEPGELDVLMRTAPSRQPIVCGALDEVAICATAGSYAVWRDVAHLE